jgi:hypothetical protein
MGRRLVEVSRLRTRSRQIVEVYVEDAVQEKGSVQVEAQAQAQVSSLHARHGSTP